MGSAKHSYHPEVNEEFLKKLDDLADLAILKRSWPGIVMNVLIFMAILTVTPLFQRYPRGVIFFGTLTLVLSTARLWLVFRWDKIQGAHNALGKALFYSGMYLAAISWGLFCAFIVSFFELGWTSFFVLLMTVGICAASVPNFAPKFSISRIYLGMMFLPSVLATWGFVGGLKGYALGVFFFGFFILLLTQSKLQNLEYTRAITDHARLQAMINAVPGALSWVSSDFKYIGANQKLARIWKLRPEQFIGKSLGFADRETEFVRFVKNLFQGSELQTSRELEVALPEGETRYYYIVGEKYHEGTEAVVIGVDITDYKKTVSELAVQKTQSKYSARLASLGEIGADLGEEIRIPVLEINRDLAELQKAVAGRFSRDDEASGILNRATQSIRHLIKLSDALHRFSQSDRKTTRQEADLVELVEDSMTLCAERMRQANIRLTVRKEAGRVIVHCKSNEIQEVIVNLLTNAYDALFSSSGEKWIEIDVRSAPKFVCLSITDSGSGIPEPIRQKIFEPLFTTKAAGQSTGVGLSAAKEILQSHGGRIELNTESPNTRFDVYLPI